jgi:astacin
MYRPWQHLHLATVALAIISFGVSGCDSDPTGVEPGDGGAAPEAPAPVPGDWRTGYIRGHTGRPLEIKFKVVDSMAIREGDIMIGRADRVATSPDELGPRIDGPGGPSFGIVIDGSAYRWPGGIVPYYIDPSVSNPQEVRDAIAHIEANTVGVDLVPYSGQADYVHFFKGTGCWSYVGRQGHGQFISLGTGCGAPEAVHEILHALGMEHEQSRCDRDSYVQILTANIKPAELYNFEKMCDGRTDLFGYAENSIMHYGAYAFSANGLPTIKSLRGLPIGQRVGLGPTDITTIDRLYPGVTASAWTTRSAMPTARRQISTAVLNGAIYALGGTNTTPTGNLTKVESYNPSTNAWTTRPSLPSGRGRTAGAATINGVLYVAGGFGAGTTAPTKTLYAFNGSSWTTKAAMPVAGGCGGAGAVGSMLYVLVGCDPTTTATANSKGILLQYNPATNAWSTKPAAPGPHKFPGVAALGGKLYVVGGKNSIGVVTNELHVYNPATNTWSTKAGMPAARYNLTAYAVGTQLYAVGGQDGGDAFTKTVYVYNPSTNTWKTAPSMPTARAGAGAAAVNGALYVIGGYSSTVQAFGTNERLVP